MEISALKPDNQFCSEIIKNKCSMQMQLSNIYIKCKYIFCIKNKNILFPRIWIDSMQLQRWDFTHEMC